jgi:hypothetical protein
MQWKGARSVMLSSRGRGRSMHIDLQNGGCYATKIDAPVHSGGKVNETMTVVPSPLPIVTSSLSRLDLLMPSHGREAA